MRKRLYYALLFALPLAGCLEVDQHPPYVNGAYDGKSDDLPEQVMFKGESSQWAKVVAERHLIQNEYHRTRTAEGQP